ncbi:MULTISPECIES: hypothetical protein [Myroides]|uniref:hypothetical protein n=1 Tax=Myroides TaxID=76831 RepID=UPI002578929F|nr:hypothetical protein [Myroides marinus]MDM1533407.1 hypothetical protein [Myroides marinus]MDM1540411.1 hypothetical protein [Myroides marinus]
MKKIKSITLRNFKFFYDTEIKQPQNKLVLDGNHLLLYGENGSGKSSLYWALYTFLQSAIKSDQDQIKKYFDPTHTENLRNRFADDEHESGIEIEFEIKSGGEIKKRITRHNDSTYELNCFQDKDIQKVLEGSDFINYKFLSKIYDFRNSEPIDLFPMFERDILMFIDFEQAYTDHNGNLTTNTYASDWWRFITDEIHNLPKNKHKISEGSDAYKRFQNTTIPKFIGLLIKFLKTISDETNRYLKEEFKEDFTINFDYDAIICEFNKRIEGKAKEKDGKLYPPKIPLKAYYNNPNLREHKREIVNPHTFLNEARLTAIALAIRLAMLKERLELEGYARILVLDDLLLSLDMSHRDKVLDVILSKSFTDTYQIMVLTHDRAFYHLCKKRIDYRYSSGWVFKEVYQHETETGIPCPFIPEQKNYLDLAKKYLKEYDYPASANYLRKESEKRLRELLPLNKTISNDLDNGSQQLLLNALIKKFEDYYKEIGGDYSPFEKLKEYKDLLMNPLSHHNIESPIYKQELINTFEILNKLNKIKIKRFEADPENLVPLVLREIHTNGDIYDYTLYLREMLLVRMDLDGSIHFNNPNCFYESRQNISKNTDKEDLNFEFKLNEGYSKIRFALGIRVRQADGSYIDNVKPLNEIIYKDGNLIL